jgi:hypothetical protein
MLAPVGPRAYLSSVWWGLGGAWWVVEQESLCVHVCSSIHSRNCNNMPSKACFHCYFLCCRGAVVGCAQVAWYCMRGGELAWESGFVWDWTSWVRVALLCPHTQSLRRNQRPFIFTYSSNATWPQTQGGGGRNLIRARAMKTKKHEDVGSHKKKRKQASEHTEKAFEFYLTSRYTIIEGRGFESKHHQRLWWTYRSNLKRKKNWVLPVRNLDDLIPYPMHDWHKNMTRIDSASSFRPLCVLEFSGWKPGRLGNPHHTVSTNKSTQMKICWHFFENFISSELFFQ